MTSAPKKKTSRPSQRRKPSTSRKKKAAPSVWWTVGRVALILVFCALMAGSAYVVWYGEFRAKTGVATDWVDGVLLAAGLDLDQHKVIADRDGIERWKVTVPSRAVKDRIIQALETGVQSQSGVFKDGGESWRQNSYIHLAELRKTNGAPLRLIFVVEARKRPKQPEPVVVADDPKPPPIKVPPPVTPKSSDLEKNAPKVAIILDDIGNKPISQLKPVLDLDYPITFAVLPYLAHTKSTAMALHQDRYEVILHMPMQPSTGDNPGKGAILSIQNESEIRANVRAAMQDVPFIVGVNNHMGSRITVNRDLMRPVLEEVRNKGYFFIDSRTAPNTVAYRMAMDMDMRTAKRHVFIDAESTYEFAKKQMNEIRKVARRDGVAVAIGHPYPGTLKALAEEMPKMDQEGFHFVFSSKLVHTKADLAKGNP